MWRSHPINSDTLEKPFVFISLSLNLGTIMVSCNTRWILSIWYAWCTSQNTDKVIPSSETNSDYCVLYSVLHWMVYYKLYWSQETEIIRTLNTSTWTYHQDNIYQILNMVLDFISIQNHYVYQHYLIYCLFTGNNLLTTWQGSLWHVPSSIHGHKFHIVHSVQCKWFTNPYSINKCTIPLIMYFSPN